MAYLKVSVWRGAGEGHEQTFDVPLVENQTVLDAVTYIQRELDPTLAYRFACRVGMCGSCAMAVNGRPRWTCRTHVSKVVKRGRISIRPCPNLPVIRDLVTDMTVFFDKWQKARGRFAPTRTRDQAAARILPADKHRRAASAAIECITCGVCYAACDVVRWTPDYLGPAALNRAWTLYNDVRHGDRNGTLRAVADATGCHACHAQQSCSTHCPMGLDPSAAIAGLRRSTLIALMKGEFKQ